MPAGMMRLLQNLSVPAILSTFHKGNETRKDDGKENSRAMQISTIRYSCGSWVCV